MSFGYLFRPLKSSECKARNRLQSLKVIMAAVTTPPDHPLRKMFPLLFRFRPNTPPWRCNFSLNLKVWKRIQNRSNLEYYTHNWITSSQAIQTNKYIQIQRPNFRSLFLSLRETFFQITCFEFLEFQGRLLHEWQMFKNRHVWQKSRLFKFFSNCA